MIYGGLFDLDSKIDRKNELDNIINDVSFWNGDNRENVLKENNSLNELINNVMYMKNKISSNIEFLNNEFILSYDHFEDIDVKPIPKETFMSIEGINKVNECTNKYYPEESLINSRELKYLDKYRDLRLIDDVQFLLLTKEGQQDDVWARIESMDEKEIFLCTLLDKPRKEFGLKKNDKIYIKYVDHPKYKGLMFVKKA